MSDFIDRQAAIDATWFEPSYTDPLNVLTEVRDRLKELPPVDAVPVKRGRWIPQGEEDSDGNRHYQCSVCGCGETHSQKVVVRYCWNCGAMMADGDEH